MILSSIFGLEVFRGKSWVAITVPDIVEEQSFSFSQDSGLPSLGCFALILLHLWVRRCVKPWLSLR